MSNNLKFKISHKEKEEWNLVAKYNIYDAEPVQVAGTDASVDASGDIYAAYDYRGRAGY